MVSPTTTSEPIATLARHRVRFVVIGGVAALARGAGWPTEDADVVIATDEANLVALLGALTDLGAVYHTLHRPPIRPDLARLRSLKGPQLFRTAHGRLDVLKEAGGDTYDSLCVDADEPVPGVLVASLEALIRTKRAANRAKDRNVLAKLEEALRRFPK